MTGCDSFNPCAIIPVYNHHAQLAKVVQSLHAQGLHCILINDGSDSQIAEKLEVLSESSADITLSHLSWNQGKGAAVMDGLMRAKAAGFTHAIQVDADGQHDTSALPELMSTAQQYPDALISGRPVYDSSVPKSRLYGRKITQFWVCIETLSRNITDAMVGFRVYPLASVCQLITSTDITRRMDFDIEIMVRLDWAGVPIKSVPVNIIYPEGGTSHFDAVQDNIRISLLHTRLFFGMLKRLPVLLPRHFKKTAEHDKHWMNHKERGTALGIRILLAVYRRLGHKAFVAMLMPVMAYFFATGRKARQASQDYLGRLYKVAPEALSAPPALKDSFRHFLSFGYTLADRFASWSGSITMEQLEIKGHDALLNHLREGEGVILLVSHLGNIELCRALADLKADDLSLMVNVLVHTRHAPAFNKVMQEVNPKSNVRLIQVSSIGPDTSIMLSEMLERGEMVAIASDRLPDQVDENTAVEACFLDEAALFPKGPFILSAILRSPVFTVFCTRKGNNEFLLDIKPFANPVKLPRKQRHEHIAQYAQQYASRLETACKQSPFEWFNFFNFWQK